MWIRIGTAAAVSLTALLLGGQQAQAQEDTFRLGGTIEAKTTTLAWDGQSETELMRGVRGFGGFRGGFGGGFGGGFRGGFGGGYRGGFGYGGFGRGFNSFAYRPFYNSFGYQPFYNSFNYGYGSSFYPSYSYASIYSPNSYYGGYNYCAPNYYGSAYYPINGTAQIVNGTTYRPAITVQPTQPVQQVTQPAQSAQPTVPMPPAGDGTYPYDGGPTNPVPLPKSPGGVIVAPSDTRIVSLPAPHRVTTKATPNFAYPPYGGNLQATTFATHHTNGTVITATKGN